MEKHDLIYPSIQRDSDIEFYRNRLTSFRDRASEHISFHCECNLCDCLEITYK